jgi:hypothetical protein
VSQDTPDQRTPVRRQRLAIAGAITLAATVWALLQSDDPAPASAPGRERVGPAPGPAGALPTRAANASSASIAAASAPLRTWPEPPRAERRAVWQAGTAQGLAAWSAPPPPPPPPAPPPPVAAAPAPPQAPPFPYTLIGRMDDGEPRALMSGPLRSFGAKAADVIDGQWRVDAIQPQGVTLTWLPGSVKKTLAFGSS